MRVTGEMVRKALDASDHCINPNTAKWMRAALEAVLGSIPEVSEKQIQTLDTPPQMMPARAGIEAQYGLNDVFPGDPYPVRQPAGKELQAACDRFNERHAVGDIIRCWTGPREGAPVERKIKYPACVMGGHTPVVYVYGGGGCIALTHVMEE